MQKLFESWRRFSEVKNYTPDPEADNKNNYTPADPDPETDYSAVGPEGDWQKHQDASGQPPDPEKEVKYGPVVNVMTSFNINASDYAAIMNSKTSRSI